MAASGPRKLIISGTITAVITAIALMALARIAGEVELSEVLLAMKNVSWANIILALMATFACYVALSGYDMIALDAVGQRRPWRVAAMGSTAGYSLSHNVGFAALTSTWARHRVYSRYGVGLADVTRIVLLTGGSFWIGVLLVFGLCLIALPDAGRALPGLAGGIQIAVGLIVIDVVVVYLLAISRGVKVLGWGKWTLPLPNLRNAIIQCGLSIAEMLLSALVLWLLIPDAGAELYGRILVAYVVAFVAVLITHAPGGAGVLETIVILMVPEVNPAALLGALILFRIVFHLLPLAAGAAILIAIRRK